MGWRFQKRVKLLPGVRVNLSKRGVSSISVGGRGGWVNFGRKRTRTTVGLPGTGLRYTSKTSPYGGATPQPQRPHGWVEATFRGKVSDQPDGRWRAEAPEFGLIVYGQSRDEAIANLEEAGDRAVADALHEVNTRGKNASDNALGRVMAFSNNLDPEARATVSTALRRSGSGFRFICWLVAVLLLVAIVRAFQH